MASEVDSALQKARDTYAMLRAEVVALSFTVAFWRRTFGTDSFVDLANVNARHSMQLFRGALLIDWTRQLCALTDPKKTGKHSNLTINRLAAELVTAIPSARNEVDPLILEIAKAVDSIRRHRHKRLMHYDLDTKATSGRLLPPVKKDHFEESSDLVFNFMNEAARLLNEPITVFEWSSVQNAEGELTWLLADKARFAIVRSAAKDEKIPDKTFRQIASRRSDREDGWILARDNLPNDLLDRHRKNAQ